MKHRALTISDCTWKVLQKTLYPRFATLSMYNRRLKVLQILDTVLSRHREKTTLVAASKKDEKHMVLFQMSCRKCFRNNPQTESRILSLFLHHPRIVGTKASAWSSPVTSKSIFAWDSFDRLCTTKIRRPPWRRAC